MKSQLKNERNAFPPIGVTTTWRVQQQWDASP